MWTQFFGSHPKELNSFLESVQGIRPGDWYTILTTHKTGDAMYALAERKIWQVSGYAARNIANSIEMQKEKLLFNAGTNRELAERLIKNAGLAIVFKEEIPNDQVQALIAPFTKYLQAVAA
jgi:hypothetical protein